VLALQLMSFFQLFSSLIRFQSYYFLPLSEPLLVSHFFPIIGCSSPPLLHLNVVLKYNLNGPNECFRYIHERQVEKILPASYRIVHLLLCNPTTASMLILIAEADISALVMTYSF
jgi:hypothetical protein